MNPVLAATSISVRIGGKTLLDDVSLSLGFGEIVAQRVKSTASASRVICVPIRFVIASVLAPRSRASFIALTVSRVSPDCEIPITSVSFVNTGLR